MQLSLKTNLFQPLLARPLTAGVLIVVIVWCITSCVYIDSVRSLLLVRGVPESARLNQQQSVVKITRLHVRIPGTGFRWEYQLDARGECQPGLSNFEKQKCEQAVQREMRRIGVVQTGRSWLYISVYYIVLISISVLCSWGILFRLNNMRAPMTCTRCGYDLRGLRDSRCPECGEAVETSGG